MPEIVLEKKGANGHHKFTLTVTETSYSIQDNTSVVSFSLKISKVHSGYNYNWGTNNPSAYDEVVTIDGTSYTAHNGKYDGSSVTTYISGTQTINHLTDGTKSIAVSFSVNDKTGQSYTSGDASASGTLALTNIPRYATSNQSLSSRTETSMTIAWSSDNTIDYVWYSKDNGSNWTAVGSVSGTSGSYTISGLTANTSYTVKTRIRRADSQLTTDSSGASWSTYPYPYINSVGTSALTIGSQQTLALYNPLGRTCSVYMKKDSTSGSQIYSGSTSSETIPFTPNASTMYGLIPNSKSGNCVYYLVYNDGTTNHTSATKSGTFVVNENTNRPTITSSTFVDTNTTTRNLTQDQNKIVLNASNMTLTIVVNAKNNATFNNGGYIKVNGTSLTLTISGSNATGVYTLNKPSSSSFSVVINDSRGISTSTTITMPSYVNYFIPTIVGNAKRNQPTNNIIDASASGTFFNGSFGSITNYITSSYKVYNTSTGTLLTSGSFTISQSGNTHTEQEVQIPNALYTEQYRVEVYVSDRINMTQSNVIVPKGVPIFNWDNDNFNINVDTNILGNVVSSNVISKNLIDENNPIIGTNSSWVGNGSTHYVSATTSWNIPVTWWIPIKVGEQYAFKYKQRNSSNLYLYITEYDNINGTILKRIVNDGTRTSYSFTIENNGYLAVRFNNNAVISNVEISEIQLERGSVVTSYTPYFTSLYEVTNELEGNKSIGNVCVKSVRTKNLLGTKAFLRGRINETTGAIENQDRVNDVGIGSDYVTITTNASWSGAYTDNYIEVDENEIYNLNFTTTNSSNSWGSVYCYDSSKNFLGQATKTNISTSANYSIKIELKPNTKYARVVLQNTASGTITYSKLQLEKGLLATNFTPYQDLDGSVLDTQLYYNNNVTSNLNYAYHNGMYFYGPDALNKPSNHGYGSIFVLNSQGVVHNNASNWCQQIAFPTDGHIYYRQKINSASWGNWQQIL